MMRIAAVMGLILALSAPPAVAVNDRDVSRFVRLSDQFNARLPRSDVRGLNDGQRKSRASCILNGVEGRYGAGGVSAVMTLMNVLAGGAQFDDPVIIKFNEDYGSHYNQVVAQCTRSARSS